MSQLANYRRAFSPLIAGTAISSTAVRTYGTLGCFARAGDTLFGLTAAHVLLKRADAAPPRVHQAHYRNHPQVSDDAIACRKIANVDAIAFALRSDQAVLPEVLDLHAWSGIAAPVQGMTLWKVGMATGLTAGVVVEVDAEHFTVAAMPHLPVHYLPFAPGDSGAVWMAQDSHALIGLHVAAGVDRRGHALRLDRVLPQMGLELLL